MHTKVHGRGKLFLLYNAFNTTLMLVHTSAVNLGMSVLKLCGTGVLRL